MKTLIFLLLIGCVGLPIINDIYVSEIEDLIPIYCDPNPLIHMHVVEYNNIMILILQQVRPMIILRYVYMENGEFVGYGLDVDLYNTTRNIVYLPDVFTNGEKLWLKSFFNRLKYGNPFEQKTNIRN